MDVSKILQKRRYIRGPKAEPLYHLNVRALINWVGVCADEVVIRYQGIDEETEDDHDWGDAERDGWFNELFDVVRIVNDNELNTETVLQHCIDALRRADYGKQKQSEIRNNIERDVEPRIQSYLRNARQSREDRAYTFRSNAEEHSETYDVEDLLEDAIKDPDLFHWTEEKPETIVRQQAKAIMRALELNGFGVVANSSPSE